MDGISWLFAIAVPTNIFFAVLSGEIAGKKGRRKLLWIALDLVFALLVGLVVAIALMPSDDTDLHAIGVWVSHLAMIAPVLGLVGILVAFLLPDLRRQAALDADRAILVKAATAINETSPAADGAAKLCPRCAELVRPMALVCRYCGHDFEASAASSPRAMAR